jgi:hypothetical protein
MDNEMQIRRYKEDLRELEKERAQLAKLRELKMRKIQTRLKLLPERFKSNHPIIIEAMRRTKEGIKKIPGETKGVIETLKPYLISAGRWLYNNQVRANSNKAFAARLTPGQEAINPETGQMIKKLPDGTYTVRRIATQMRV